MAALDLQQTMKKMAETQKIDEAMERRICAAFIKHLEDKSLDVQSNAVRSIQLTASIMSESNLVMVAEKLIDMVLNPDKKEVRDIYSLAIRSTI